MCGIAGIFNYSGPVNADELGRLTDSLEHRGPDGRGIHIDGSLGLGHRRLAILDLSEAGRCPMRYDAPGGREYWITYNGEVYNFLELKDELQSIGYRFRSESDTEVVAAAYAQWGDACQLRFNGMWAFAIWDVRERRLFISRDRFGIKPLYYMDKNGRFVFASEIKAFLELEGFVPRLDTDAARHFLNSTTAFDGTATDSALQDVKRLPGGNCMTVAADGSCHISRWWETYDHIPSVPLKFVDQVAGFRELFLDAVRIRMRSDVPVGTCLSGGVDSSAVASAMAWLQRNDSGLERCSRDWQQTFVASFPGTSVDERPFAEEVVRHIGAKPHYWIFDGGNAVGNIINSVWALDDLAGAPAVPVWSIYREMRRSNVIVSLDGHGGDELLGGYAGYLDIPLSSLNNKLYHDFHYTHMPAILRNYDRCSMAHGIEVRMPIMDWRLVTYCFGISPEAKIGRGFTKSIFRHAMQGIMPEAIRNRRAKIGFASPLIEWYNGAMAPLIRKIVNHPLWIESPFWEGVELRNQILLKTNTGSWTMDDFDRASRVWTFLSMTIWQLIFIERDNSFFGELFGGKTIENR